MTYKTKEEVNKYNREWYHKNKERRLAHNQKWKDRQWRLYNDYKQTLSCVKCGEAETCCLDFHHLDPAQKEKSVAQFMTDNNGFAKALKEIEKCIAVCANCHRKIHAGLV